MQQLRIVVLACVFVPAFGSCIPGTYSFTVYLVLPILCTLPGNIVLALPPTSGMFCEEWNL